MQLSMNFPVAVPKDAYNVGTRASGEVHGVVLTKAHIVDLVLDLAGYTADRDLVKVRLLEPACGHGALLVPAVRQLLSVVRAAPRFVDAVAGAIAAYDIDPGHVEIS